MDTFSFSQGFLPLWWLNISAKEPKRIILPDGLSQEKLDLI